MSAKDYQDDPIALLDALAHCPEVKMRHTKIPWDKDIELVDYYLKNGGQDCRGNLQ